ncbi:MAG: GNAT family N-acetyltransferase [Ignavibacterium album]|uniref:GNAT family N-acetyltransferase n=1 Tax=Ignavibacterium album TaxID=591197 RepID=UPI0026F3066F|nr:GNAT family N-acetyltransferase [Ignavibacterium album]MCX8106725.1 GNAT family N-acetyltransferase [Ignavibacterium album]
MNGLIRKVNILKNMEERIEIRGCKNREELVRVVELCDKAFDKTPYEYFERHVLKDKTLSPEDTRILLLNDEIISSVQVFPRKMYLKSETIEFCGIGNVATLPEKRRLGYAELVMKDAIDYMNKLNARFSLLTTTINKYYEKFGYRTLTRELYTIDDVMPSDQKGIRTFSFNNDFEKVIHIYECYNQNSIGPICRDNNYWISQFDFCGEDAELFLISETDNEIKAYIRAVKETDKIKLLEFAALSEYSNNFQMLLQSLASRTGINKFEIFLSESEKEKLNAHNYSKKIDFDLMILFLDNMLNENYETMLMKHNNITFWLSDFF